MAAFLLAHTINENYTVDIVDAHQELEPENTAEAYKESQNELTSKIIQSNHQPITTIPTNIPQCNIHFLDTSRDAASSTSCGQPVLMLGHSLRGKKFS